MNIIFWLFVIWLIWRIFSHKKKRTSSVLQPKVSPDIPQSSSRSISPDSVWVPLNEERTLYGYSIKGGIYYGSDLKAVNGYGIEPALIDPKLSVAKSEQGGAVRLNYWPSYRDIGSTTRTIYLQWLANGKNDPSIDIGYVFLYFYGLERRVLSDTTTSQKAAAEVAENMVEIKRLLGIYGANYSFNQYASNLVDFVEIKTGKDKLYKTSIDIDASFYYELPLRIRVGLAQLTKENVPLPADWALALVKCDPENRLRTPAHRCKEELKKLFHSLYKEEFGEGLLLSPKNSKLSVSYRPASQTFGGALSLDFEGLPDVNIPKRELNKLHKIADSCINQLDAYSRYLGRNPERKDSLAAWALLPERVVHSTQMAELQGLSKWLADTLRSENMIQADLSDLLDQISLTKNKEIDKQGMLSLSQILSKFEVGLEPDLRFGSPLITSGKILLFTLPEDVPSAPSSEYTAAASIMRLAIAVAMADGNVSVDEEKYIERRVEIIFNLDPAEKIRLSAYIKWLLLVPSNFSGIKKQIQMLKRSQREAIGKLLVSIAQADGFIGPDEVKALNKVYSILDLDVQDLYSQAHLAATEPVKIESGDSPLEGFSIPSRPKKSEKKGVELDIEAINRKISETAAVTALLNNIFSEEDTEKTVPIQESSKEVGILGLDSLHSKFAQVLIEKSSWTREELEQLASNQNILLDGALDTINDAAFKAFNEPFFEGDESIEMNAKIAKEILK
jgi:tellurite resistance protein